MVSQKGKLTVIVPVYNVEEFLARCLDSLVEQTYKNMEIVLVDDGSPDKSGEICDEYAKKYSHIKVLHVENAGVSAARNRGMKEATGDYVAFCDSDDWLEKHAYEKMMIPVLKEDVDIAAFGWYVDNTTTLLSNETENAYCGYGDEAEFFKAILSKSGGFGGKTAYGNYIWNKIYKKSVLYNAAGELIGFNPQIKVAEDGLWLVEVAENCKKSYFDSEPLYHYFANVNSVMRDHERYMETRMGSQRSHIMMLERLKNYNVEYYNIHRDTCTDYFWTMVRNNPILIDAEFVYETINNIISINDGKITREMSESIYYYMRINRKYQRSNSRFFMNSAPVRYAKKAVKWAIRKVKNN